MHTFKTNLHVCQWLCQIGYLYTSAIKYSTMQQPQTVHSFQTLITFHQEPVSTHGDANNNKNSFSYCPTDVIVVSAGQFRILVGDYLSINPKYPKFSFLIHNITIQNFWLLIILIFKNFPLGTINTSVVIHTFHIQAFFSIINHLVYLLNLSTGKLRTSFWFL